MARTKASVGAKVSSGKSTKARCSVAPPSSNSPAGSSERTSKGYSGGNPVCPRETPKWQKPITNFFIGKDGNHIKEANRENTDEGSEGISKSKSRKNVIQSDDEEILNEKPTNSVLDDTLELEPLNGEDSHKIDEFYKDKGKAAGKKMKGKENRRNKKRVRGSEDVDNVAKKVKLD